MGTLILFMTLIFLSLALLWYRMYAQKKAAQDSALIYVLEKLVARDKNLTSDSLLTELKDIVIQRDEIELDRFHKLIEESEVLDIEAPLKMEDFFKEVSRLLSKELDLKPEELFNKFIERERLTSTVVRDGLAIPHIVVSRKDYFKIILVRAKTGIIFPDDKLIHVAFVLVGSSGERSLHLKDLAAIAQVVQNPEFDKKWLAARNEEELRNIVLLTERRRG
jgi:mannitol/fructose-specific phosphotransferase system IIA component (Ntr-type)